MNKATVIILGLLLSTATPLIAAEDESGKPPKIFTTGDVIEAVIEAPWREISRKRREARTWQGTFRFTSANGSQASIPVILSLRGLTRLRVCDFPPLRVDFDKEASKGTEFRGAGNLKLVTHCFRSERYAQYYVKEYLAYRIFNLLTPRSFRVQGLDIDYVDSDGEKGPGQRFGFLIEDPDDVAKRNGLEKLNIEETQPVNLDPMDTTRFMLFQYMIANLDWSVLSGPGSRCCHNARIIAAEPTSKVHYAIPYDLDSAGLVNAHYAAPPDNLRVRDVRQRLFRGFCVHNESITAALEEFRVLQGEIIGLFENEPRLTSRARSDSTKFVEGFYRVLEDDKDVQKKLIGSCRG